MNITAREANGKTKRYEDGVGIDFFKLVDSEVAKEIVRIEEDIQAKLKTEKNTKYYINFPDVLTEKGRIQFLLQICAELTNVGFDVELDMFINFISLNISWEEGSYRGDFELPERMAEGNDRYIIMEKYNEIVYGLRMRDLNKGFDTF